MSAGPPWWEATALAAGPSASPPLFAQRVPALPSSEEQADVPGKLREKEAVWSASVALAVEDNRGEPRWPV